MAEVEVTMAEWVTHLRIQTHDTGFESPSAYTLKLIAGTSGNNNDCIVSQKLQLKLQRQLNTKTMETLAIDRQANSPHEKLALQRHARKIKLNYE